MSHPQKPALCMERIAGAEVDGFCGTNIEVKAALGTKPL